MHLKEMQNDVKVLRKALKLACFDLDGGLVPDTLHLCRDEYFRFYLREATKKVYPFRVIPPKKKSVR